MRQYLKVRTGDPCNTSLYSGRNRSSVAGSQDQNHFHVFEFIPWSWNWITISSKGVLERSNKRWQEAPGQLHLSWTLLKSKVKYESVTTRAVKITNKNSKIKLIHLSHIFLSNGIKAMHCKKLSGLQVWTYHLLLTPLYYCYMKIFCMFCKIALISVT